MAFKRPSFLPSLDDLEQQAQDRSAQKGRPGSQFDHPTARALFIAIVVLTIAAHVIGGVLFLFVDF